MAKERGTQCNDREVVDAQGDHHRRFLPMGILQRERRPCLEPDHGLRTLRTFGPVLPRLSLQRGCDRFLCVRAGGLRPRCHKHFPARHGGRDRLRWIGAARSNSVDVESQLKERTQSNYAFSVRPIYGSKHTPSVGARSRASQALHQCVGQVLAAADTGKRGAGFANESVVGTGVGAVVEQIPHGLGTALDDRGSQCTAVATLDSKASNAVPICASLKAQCPCPTGASTVNSLPLPAART